MHPHMFTDHLDVEVVVVLPLRTSLVDWNGVVCVGVFGCVCVRQKGGMVSDSASKCNSLPA